MNGNPSKKQQDFHEWARQLGCITECGQGPVAIHHIGGARMKLKGVEGFAGEWYILPLSYFWHQDGDNEAARHVSKVRFIAWWEKTEKEWWLILMEKFKEQFDCYPMTDHEYQIIKDRA